MFGLEIWIAGVMLISLIIYMLTGGADFGGGIWDLFATGKRAKFQRNLISHAIAPIWEANHVWLIVIIVLLFGSVSCRFCNYWHCATYSADSNVVRDSTSWYSISYLEPMMSNPKLHIYVGVVCLLLPV